MREAYEDDRQYERVLWRSRRGMLELDLVLIQFVRSRYALLTCADQKAYRGLLDQDDWTVWQWLQCRAKPPKAFAGIVEQIVGFVADGAHQRRE